MYLLIHEQLMRADPRPRPVPAAHRRPGRGHPPPRRLRGPAAQALGALALRLDAERARRAIA
jgi:hypothetical protein